MGYIRTFHFAGGELLVLAGINTARQREKFYKKA